MEQVAVFADTSVLYAFLDGGDKHHARVVQTWAELGEAGVNLLTTNYVAVESSALLQKRLGLAAVQRLATYLLPAVELEWVLPEEHDAALEALLLAGKRDLSLVDCVSFIVMRRLGLERAFTLDPHFREQGFECLPEPAGRSEP